MNQTFVKHFKKLIPLLPVIRRGLINYNKMCFFPFKPKVGIGRYQNIPILKSPGLTANNFSSNDLNSEWVEKSIEMDEPQNDWCVPELDKETLLKNVNLGNDKDSNGLKVLKYISELPGIGPGLRVASANLHFSKMRSDGVNITKSHYICLLECYLKCKYFGDLKEFLMTMESDGVELDEEVKAPIIKCLAEAGLGKQISEIVKSGEEEKFSLKNKNDYYSAIIYSYGLSGDFAGALEKFNELKRKGFPFESSVYAALIRIFSIKMDESMLEILCKEVLEKQINIQGDDIFSILRELAVSHRLHLLETVKCICSDETLMKIGTELIIELVHQNEIQSAFSLAANLLNFKCDDQSMADVIMLQHKMFKSLIETLINLNYPASNLLKKCSKLRKSKCSLLVHEFALYNYLKRGDISKSLMALREMSNENIFIKPFYFWPLLILAKKSYGDNGVIEILKNMKEMNVFINEETLVNYVFPNISTLSVTSEILERIDFIQAEFVYIQEVFIKYTLSNRLFKNCLQFLVRSPLKMKGKCQYLKDLCIQNLINFSDEEDISAIIKILGIFDLVEVLEHLTAVQDTQIISNVVMNLTKNKLEVSDEKRAREIFDGLKRRCNLVIDFGELLNSHEATPKYDEDSNKRKRVQEVDKSMYLWLNELEERELFLGELKARDSCLKGIGLKIVKNFAIVGLYKSAIRVRNELYKVYGPAFDLSPSKFMYLAKVAAYENDVEMAMSLFRALTLTHDVFHMYVPSALILARLLIENRHFDEMYEVLRKIPGNVSNKRREKNCVLLLRKVATLGEPDKTDLVFKLLLGKGLIKVTQNTLQAYIATYLKKNDLEGAVKEFRRLAEEHDIHSNTVYLLRALVEGRRFDLFDSVVRILESSRPKRQYKILALAVTAGAGDADSFHNYSQVFSVDINDDRLWKVFLKLCPTAAACRAFIQVAKRNSQPYESCLKTAIDSIYMKGDYDEARKFLDFCEDLKIELEKETIEKLRNFDELGKVLKASLI